MIHRLKEMEPDSSCHILFIGGSDAESKARMIKSVRGRNVLTVTDAGNSETSAAIINFVIADNRVRFDINDEAAAQNGLVLSSKLMSLALNVKKRTSKENR